MEAISGLARKRRVLCVTLIGLLRKPLGAGMRWYEARLRKH
jgi:hypothetical protein